MTDFKIQVSRHLAEVFQGETQEVTARKLNTTQGNVSKWVCGSQVPTSDMLCEISKAYKVSVDWIMGISSQKEIDGVVLEKLTYEQITRIMDVLFQNKNFSIPNLAELAPKDSSYEYKATSNAISDLYSDRKKSINVFTQRENIGCTFEYELLLHNPTCKELIVPSITNGDTLLFLMNNYAKKYEEMVAAVCDSEECKRIKDDLSGSKNKDQLIAALYLLYVSKAESAQEIAEVLNEKEADYLKGTFSFKIPPYIEGAIKWVLE